MRAERAHQILNDELVREALDGIKSGIVEAWRTAPVKDRDLKEQLWGLLNAAHKFEEVLQTHITTGKLARLGEQEKTWRDRLRLA